MEIVKTFMKYEEADRTVYQFYNNKDIIGVTAVLPEAFEKNSGQNTIM